MSETEDMNKRGNTIQFFFNVDTFINVIHLIKEDEIKICINNASNAVISAKKSNYILRILTADKKLRRGAISFFLYPFTPMAIIDNLLEALAWYKFAVAK